MEEHKKITKEEYANMWGELKEGRVAESEWREFCDIIFKQLLEDNKDVMIRLKNR
jgi:hypothetical protein